MAAFSRVLVLCALAGIAVAALSVTLLPSGANAGTAVATCTKAPDLRYDCTKVLAVGDHVELNASPGVCHGNVASTGVLSPTLRSAKIDITHTVTNCPWQPGGSTTISYRVAGTPTPTGNAVAVGGIAGLLGAPEGDSPASGGSGGGAGVALALALLGGASLAIVAGLVARRRPGAAASRE